MTTTFACETIAPCRGSGADQLLEAHYREIAHFQDIELSIDWPAYEQMEAAGLLKIYTARSDGALIGYVVYVVNYAPHYKESLQAIQDVIYIEPTLRGAGIGAELVLYSERELKALGVQVVYQHGKMRHPALSVVLKGLGYECVDFLMAKRLDKLGTI